jgi:hypothetical protein
MPKGNPFKKKHKIFMGAGKIGNKSKGIQDKTIKINISFPLPIFLSSEINLMPKILLAV